jgi:hypothetical protein
MIWPLLVRRVYCWLWNRLHGYPRGSISDDGTVVTLSTGKCPDNWFYKHHCELNADLKDDPVWPNVEEEE